MTHDIHSIETPAFMVNEEIALRNIHAFQAHCNAAGLALRPHIKTHKLVHFAKAQIAAGATGITCQKIGEAEVMADGGIEDILISYNILGKSKIDRLRALASRLSALSVAADNAVVIAGLAEAFATAEKPLTVLIECDTGGKRCGVQSPQAAVDLAEGIVAVSGLRFGGLMTYPAAGGAKHAAVFLRETVDLLKAKGIDCPTVSSGGSPDMWSAATYDVITEYRIGTYIYNDRSLVGRGACTWSACAGHVIATVVSTPTPQRAIIDAGSKVLTSDLLGFADHGYVVDHPEIRITGLSEEHAILEVDPKTPLTIGQRVSIIPNHVCVVSNMFDDIWIANSKGQMATTKVDARGKVT